MLNLNKYNTIIFDLDGTLVDSVPELSLALNHALENLQLNSVSQHDVRAWVGNGSVKLVERALESMQLNSKVNNIKLHKQFLISYEQCLAQKSELYPGVITLLNQLHQENKTLALITNKPIQFVPELLNKMEIAHLFSLVLGGDSLAEKKPHPLPLLHVMETLNVNSSQCLMVGDSRSDIVCAQQANVDCVALLQGYHQGVDLPALNPTYIFNDIAALANGLNF